MNTAHLSLTWRDRLRGIDWSYRPEISIEALALAASVFFALACNHMFWRSAMASHPGSIGFALSLLLFRCIIGCITDGCRIDEHFCSLQCHESGCFRIPLVPANQNTQFAY